jgi:rod shape-determining protein MreD
MSRHFGPTPITNRFGGVISPLALARAEIVLLLLVAVLLQTTIGPDLRIGAVAPDFLILIVIGAAMTGGPEHGALVGFFAGLLADLLVTDTPVGLGALTYCVVGYGLGALRTTILHDTWLLRPVVVAVGTAAAVALYVGAGDIVGQSQLVASGPRWVLRVALIEAAFNAVLAVPVGRLYERLARPTKGSALVGRGRRDGTGAA